METPGKPPPPSFGPVLHIVVVGFHHKKGCQVEFSYPPLIPREGHDSHSLPEEWKYLPFLALPDGAHNYQEDTVYFHLPPRCGDRTTIYGVSCYRQIEAKEHLWSVSVSLFIKLYANLPCKSSQKLKQARRICQAS